MAGEQVEHVVEEADPVEALASPPSRSSWRVTSVSLVLRSISAVRLVSADRLPFGSALLGRFAVHREPLGVGQGSDSGAELIGPPPE